MQAISVEPAADFGNEHGALVVSDSGYPGQVVIEQADRVVYILNEWMKRAAAGEFPWAEIAYFNPWRMILYLEVDRQPGPRSQVRPDRQAQQFPPRARRTRSGELGVVEDEADVDVARPVAVVADPGAADKVRALAAERLRDEQARLVEEVELGGGQQVRADLGGHDSG
jgi:hypothetical protein